MLPDFPNTKNKLATILNNLVKLAVKKDPLLSQVKEVPVFEGEGLAIQREDGTIDRTNFKKIESPITINKNEIIEKGINAYIDNVIPLARGIINQQKAYMFSEISRVTEEVGNVVNAQGQPFTFDLFIQLVRKIEISFDDNDKPIMPTLTVSPDIGKKLSDPKCDWNTNPEYIKRFEEIINQKRKEWHDRESNRKLVD